MSTVENYDGLCGCIATYASSSVQLRCKYELGHGGAHSWEKYREQFVIQSHCGPSVPSAERSFINSVIFHTK